ncbi:MAG: hypothetical protein RMJ82_14080 [Gemmatales bacterium]|nr:hypothetical protein [Gemmatales bacterium]
MHRLTPVCGVVLCFSGWVWPDDAAELRQSARTALARAARYLHEKVSVRGTYLWRYSGDLIQRFGERRATATQGWIQPPGTPSVALALLRATRLPRRGFTWKRHWLRLMHSWTHYWLVGVVIILWNFILGITSVCFIENKWKPGFAITDNAAIAAPTMMTPRKAPYVSLWK